MRLAVTRYIDVSNPTIEQIEKYLTEHAQFEKTNAPDGSIEYKQKWRSLNIRIKFEDIPEAFRAEYLFSQIVNLIGIPPVSLYRYVMGRDIEQEDFEKIVKCGQ